MLEHQVTDNGVIMETDDEKISARIKMIDETEVTQSAQALTTQPQLHHLLQSGSSGFRVVNFTVASIAVAATVISCRLNEAGCRPNRCSRKRLKAAVSVGLDRLLQDLLL